MATKGKIDTKFAPKLQPTFTPVEPLLVRQAVAHMTDDQFAAYDSALREIDFYALSPVEQQNYTVAIQAVNERRQQEGFNVRITDGNRPSLLPALPGGLQWAPLIAIAAVVLIASRL